MQPMLLGKNRLEALSDGVFAIAMTLLVLDLKVPERTHHMNGAEMVHQLSAMWPAFLSYAITFLLAGTFWYTHHVISHFVQHTDKGFLWLNLLFLMMVSLLPFSAGLLTHMSVHPVSQLFYYGNQLSIAVLLLAQWEYARARKMLAPNARPEDLQNVTWRLRTAFGAFLSAVVTGMFRPEWTSYALIGGFALGRIMIRIAQRRRTVTSVVSTSV